MGLLNPSRGVVDFDGFRALKPLYEAALDAGIWIVLRPGTFQFSSADLGYSTLRSLGPVSCADVFCCWVLTVFSTSTQRLLQAV